MFSVAEHFSRKGIWTHFRDEQKGYASCNPSPITWHVEGELGIMRGHTCKIPR